MRLALQIAVRFLRSGKAQTWFIILGIAIGVAVQVFIGSLIIGLQKSLVDKTIGSSSQITIRGDAPIDDYEALLSSLSSERRLEVVSPALDTVGTLYKDTTNTPIKLRGFEFDQSESIYHFADRLVEGRLPEVNEVILGLQFRDGKLLKINDIVEIDIPLVGSFNYTIVGFFDFKVAIINEQWGVTSLASVQTMLGITSITSIEMQIKDNYIFDANLISEDLKPNIGSLNISTWIDDNEELLSGLQGQSLSSIMIQVFVMISVVLGIASVLAIIVMQKSKQIGILKAMGIQNIDASFIFIFEGLILGILGAILGVALGVGLAFAFKEFAVNSDGSPVIPLTLDYGFIVLSMGIAVTASVVASIIPARKSSKLTVIEVIKNG
ncbi:MAG: FtsX-like permease family protein [Bacilli bacterium]